MAQRGWLVRPDHEVDTFDPDDGYAPLGAVGAVSQQALAKAVLDGVVMLDRAGGVLSVTVTRTRTGVPGERVTSGAMVEWKDRTDARPQPEPDYEEPAPPHFSGHGAAADPLAAVASAQEPKQPSVNGVGTAEAVASQVAVSTEQEMPEVDDRDVPAGLRGL